MNVLLKLCCWNMKSQSMWMEHADVEVKQIEDLNWLLRWVIVGAKKICVMEQWNFETKNKGISMFICGIVNFLQIVSYRRFGNFLGLNWNSTAQRQMPKKFKMEHQNFGTKRKENYVVTVNGNGTRRYGGETDWRSKLIIEARNRDFVRVMTKNVI